MQAMQHSPTHRIASDTVYYAEGPQQARPPEGVLAAGTTVRVGTTQGDYLLVETDDGRRGFVLRSAVVPLH